MLNSNDSLIEMFSSIRSRQLELPKKNETDNYERSIPVNQTLKG